MDSFFKLSEEKQNCIISAAYRCFAKNGYDKTSVADIAKAASISKSSIFLYFGTKTELYHFLLKFAYDLILKEMPQGSEDFFECLHISADIKLNVMKRYPGMLDFLYASLKETNSTVLPEMYKQTAFYIAEGSKTLFAKVNWQKFKPSISLEKAVNIVWWVGESYLKAAENNTDLDNAFKELWEYMELLKSAFYKEEYL